MAIKTIKLYPTSHFRLENLTYYPADTAQDQIHLLLAESIADEDASYVSFQNTAISNGVRFQGVPNITPSTIRVIVRARCLNNETLIPYFCYGYGKEWDSSTDSSRYVYKNYNWNNEPFLLTTTYENYIVTLPEDIVDSAWDWICGGYEKALIDSQVAGDPLSETAFVYFFVGGGSTGGGKPSELRARVTQIYLEVDYEVEVDDSTLQEIYLKENGAWQKKQVYIYQKLNSAWEPADKSVLGSVKYVIDTTTQEGG